MGWLGCKRAASEAGCTETTFPCEALDRLHGDSLGRGGSGLRDAAVRLRGLRFADLARLADATAECLADLSRVGPPVEPRGSKQRGAWRCDGDAQVALRLPGEHRV